MVACAVMFGQQATVSHFLNKHPHLVTKDATAGPQVNWGLVAGAVASVGDVNVLRMLLDAGLPHDLLKGRVTHPFTRKIIRISNMMIRLKKQPKALFNSFGLTTSTTALHVASHHGNLGAVQLLLERSASPLSNIHPYKMTPLHLACSGGHDAIVNVLLDAGSSINAKDINKRTAAAWARRRGHFELAERLDGLIKAQKVVS